MKILPCFLAAVCLFAASCAGVKNTRSGYLSSYEGLAPAADGRKKNRIDVVRPGFDWNRYGSVAVERVEVKLGEKDAKKVNAKDIAKLKNQLTEIAEKEFAGVPGNGLEKIRIRTVVTELDTVNVGVNLVASVVAVPVDNGGISIELEVLDAATGKQLYALTGYEKGLPYDIGGFITKLGHAKSGFRKLVRHAAKRLKETPGS